MLRLALKLMRSCVKRKAGADINSVSPLDVVGRSLIPAMFGHGEQDSFIDLQHSAPPSRHSSSSSSSSSSSQLLDGRPAMTSLARWPPFP